MIDMVTKNLNNTIIIIDSNTQRISLRRISLVCSSVRTIRSSNSNRPQLLSALLEEVAKYSTPVLGEEVWMAIRTFLTSSTRWVVVVVVQVILILIEDMSMKLMEEIIDIIIKIRTVHRKKFRIRDKKRISYSHCCSYYHFS